MTNGIYLLANDVVFDHLIALLNSIETNIGRDISVCVIPYDDRIDRVKAEIVDRKQVSLFENCESIAYWEDYATQAWQAHHKAQREWKLKGWATVHALKMHRKFCSFDGEFDRFVYFDADTLAMGSLDYIFEKLNHYDWVTNDFQFRSDINYVFDTTSPKFTEVYDPEAAKAKIFCAGWFASKKNVIDRATLSQLLEQLKAGEAETMSLRGTDQPLFNYLIQRSGVSFYNFAYTGEATGSHWSSQFDEVDHVLYDHGNRLTYLHYMSISAAKFAQLCEGFDVELPYRDLFLHYRYLQNPIQRPTQFVKPKQTQPLQKFLNQKMDNLKYKLQQLTTQR
jgi:hypothetical protein